MAQMLTRRTVLGFLMAGLTGERAWSGVSESLRQLQDLEKSLFSFSASPSPLRIRNPNTGEEMLAPLLRNENGKLVWEESTFLNLDWLLRDWRENKTTQMDRRVYVFLYLLQMLSERLHGVRSHIEVISGFRTERTNLILRGIYRETVALNSFHMHGRAVDFRVSGLPTRLCAHLAWNLSLGGVGLYGDRFVHCDTGPRRHWGDFRPT